MDDQIKSAQFPNIRRVAPTEAQKVGDALQSSTQKREPSPGIAENLEAVSIQRAHYYCDLERM
jgi:hypothetical protein